MELNLVLDLHLSPSRCSWTFTSDSLRSSGDREGIFLSPSHWYPPGSNCTWRLVGSARRKEIVRVYFPSFRVAPGGVRDPVDPGAGSDCAESLTLYDSDRIQGAGSSV